MNFLLSSIVFVSGLFGLDAFAAGPANSPNAPLVCPLRLKKAQMCLAYQWLQPLKTRAPLSLELRFAGPLNDGEKAVPVEPIDKPYVFLLMPSMGHGSPMQPRIEKSGPGTYRVHNLLFSMPGEWEIHFQLRQGAMIVDEVLVPVQL